MGHTAQGYEKLWVSADYVLLSVARVWIATRSERKVKAVCSIANRSEYSLPRQPIAPVGRRINQRPDRRHWLCSLSNADKHIRRLLATGVFVAFDASGKQLLVHDDVKPLLITPSRDSALSLDVNKIEDANSFSGVCLHKQKLLERFRPAEAFEEEFFAHEAWTGEMAAFYLKHRTHREYFNEEQPAPDPGFYQDLNNFLQKNDIEAFKDGRNLKRGYWFGKSVRNDTHVSFARSSILHALKTLDAQCAEHKDQGQTETYADTLNKLFELGRKSSFNQAAYYLHITHRISKKAAASIVEKDGRFEEAKPGRPSNAVTNN